MGSAVMHWGRQVTLLSLSVEKHQYHLRASTGGFAYSTAVVL